MTFFQSSVITKYSLFLKTFFNLDCHEKMQGCTQAPGLCQSHSCPSRMFCCHHNCSTIKKKIDEADHFKMATEDTQIGFNWNFYYFLNCEHQLTL
jgi:hypothetical protein